MNEQDTQEFADIICNGIDQDTIEALMVLASFLPDGDA